MVIALVAVLLLSRHYERLLRALGNRPVLASGITVAVLMVVVAIPVSLWARRCWLTSGTRQ